MNKSAEKVKLTSFDDLFGTASLDSGERVTTVPLSQLHTFKDHPFRVSDDEKMQETVESIVCLRKWFSTYRLRKIKLLSSKINT